MVFNIKNLVIRFCLSIITIPCFAMEGSDDESPIISFDISGYEGEICESFCTIKEQSTLLEQDKLFLKKNALEAYLVFTNSENECLTIQPFKIGTFLSGTSSKAPSVPEVHRRNALDFLASRPDSVKRNSQNKNDLYKLANIPAKKTANQSSTETELTEIEQHNSRVTALQTAWVKKAQNAWDQSRSIQFCSTNNPSHGIEWLIKNEECKNLFLKCFYYAYRASAFMNNNSLHEYLSHTETWALATVILEERTFVESAELQKDRTAEEIKTVHLNMYSRKAPCLICRANLESATQNEKSLFLEKILGGGRDLESISFAINVYSLYDDNWKVEVKKTSFPLDR